MKKPRTRTPMATPGYVRINAASEIWPISRATFYRAIARGELEKIKRGSIAMLRVADVEKWLTASN